MQGTFPAATAADILEHSCMQALNVLFIYCFDCLVEFGQFETYDCYALFQIFCCFWISVL